MKRLRVRTKGGWKYAFVDGEDYGNLSRWKWYAAYRGRSFYAYRNCKLESDGTCRGSVFMHRVIMKTPKGLDTDHINGNGLDNRKSNLRICSRTVNGQNRVNRNINNSSGFTGVTRQGKKWAAQIERNKDGGRRAIYIGTYSTRKEAAAFRWAFVEMEKLNPQGLQI